MPAGVQAPARLRLRWADRAWFPWHRCGAAGAIAGPEFPKGGGEPRLLRGRASQARCDGRHRECAAERASCASSSSGATWPTSGVPRVRGAGRRADHGSREPGAARRVRRGGVRDAHRLRERRRAAARARRQAAARLARARGARRGRAPSRRGCCCREPVLAATGGALGVLLAASPCGSCEPMQRRGLPRVADTTLDWGVLAFAVSARRPRHCWRGFSRRFRPGRSRRRELSEGAAAQRAAGQVCGGGSRSSRRRSRSPWCSSSPRG